MPTVLIPVHASLRLYSPKSSKTVFIRARKSASFMLHKERSQAATCRGYVGEKTALASSYHETDFDWSEHASEIEANLLASNSLIQPKVVEEEAFYEGHKWDEFYQQHTSVKFFKERRYLLLQFPMLQQSNSPVHIVEIGAGCGSSILPVLRYNDTATATVTDISHTSLQQLLEAAKEIGIDTNRITTFTADATNVEEERKFKGLNADYLLIIFTLSAALPSQQLVMLEHAYNSLAPKGLLLIRDHGLYDMVQLRIPPEQCIGRNAYKRGDGTLAYFFSTEDLQEKAIQAGFGVIECKYICVSNLNRKTGVKLKRVFVHGVFRKP